jgi:phosphate transport system substrate-binding protein
MFRTVERRVWPAGLVIAAALGCGRQPAESPTRGRLEVAASESHGALVEREAELFDGLYPQARITVRRTTTREAYVALLADSVRLVVVDRPPNAEERRAIDDLGLAIEKVRVARDALALIVNRENGLESLALDRVALLLAGRPHAWDEWPATRLTGPIRLVVTGRNSGAWELLCGTFFPGLDPAAGGRAASLSEVLAQVAADPRAVGVVSVAAWKDRAPAPVAAAAAPGWARGVAAPHPEVRALAIAGADSSGVPTAGVLHQANIHSGAYPLHYPVYVLFNRDSRLAAGFSAFVASAPGQKLVLEAGLVPASMPVRVVQLD